MINPNQVHYVRVHGHSENWTRWVKDKASRPWTHWVMDTMCCTHSEPWTQQADPLIHNSMVATGSLCLPSSLHSTFLIKAFNNRLFREFTCGVLKERHSGHLISCGHSLSQAPCLSQHHRRGGGGGCSRGCLKQASSNTTERTWK